MKTVFPRAKFVDKNTLVKQLEHLRSEVEEVTEAFFEKENYLEKMAEETCDIIHSAETMLYKLKETFKVDVAKIQQEVIEKNRARGYYSE